MKRFLFITSCVIASLYAFDAMAQTYGPDDIVGEYYVAYEGEESRVRVAGESDGTYKAQVFWVKNKYDEDGKVRLDEKNPDKSLRTVECDRIVLVTNLKFDPDKNRWSGGKIYDPTRGIRANAVCYFASPTELKVRGSLFGISETVTWIKEK